MHPIEHLRAIARARGADPRDLVRETAYALEALHCGPGELLVACRRILDRHAEVAQLWWLCSHLLCDRDDAADLIEADVTDRTLAGEIPESATVVVLAGAPTVAAGLARRGDLEVLVVDTGHHGSAMLQYLERRDVVCEPVQPEAIAAAVGAADLVLLEADALSGTRAMTRIGGRVLATVAAAAQVPVWMVAPTGVALADQVLGAIDARLGATGRPAWEMDHEFVDLNRWDLNRWDLTGVNRVISGGPVAPFAPELTSLGGRAGSP